MFRSSQRKQSTKPRRKLSAVIQIANAADPAAAACTATNSVQVSGHFKTTELQQLAHPSGNDGNDRCLLAEQAQDDSLSRSSAGSALLVSCERRLHSLPQTDQASSRNELQRLNSKDQKKMKKKKLRVQQQHQLKLKLPSNVGRVRLNMAGRPPVVAVGAPLTPDHDAQGDDLSTSPVTVSATGSLSGSMSGSASGSATGSASTFAVQSSVMHPDSDIATQNCSKESGTDMLTQGPSSQKISEREQTRSNRVSKVGNHSQRDFEQKLNAVLSIAPSTKPSAAVYVEEADDVTESELDAAAVAKVVRHMLPLNTSMFSVSRATLHCPFSDRELDSLYSSDDDVEQHENVRRYLRIKGEVEKKQAAEVTSRLASKRPTEEAERQTPVAPRKKGRVAKEKPIALHEIPFSVESHRHLVQLMLHPMEVDMDVKMMAGLMTHAELYRHQASFPNGARLSQAGTPITTEGEPENSPPKRKRPQRGRVSVTEKCLDEVPVEPSMLELAARAKLNRKRRRPTAAEEDAAAAAVAEGLSPSLSMSTPAASGRRPGPLNKRGRIASLKANANEAIDAVSLVPELRDGRQKQFVKHPDKKGWVICRKCDIAVWPPNCNKHVQTCGKPSSDE